MRWPKTGLLIGLAVLAGGGAALGQEAPLTDMTQGKPSANAPQGKPFADLAQGKQEDVVQRDSFRPFSRTVKDKPGRNSPTPLVAFGGDDNARAPIAGVQLIHGEQAASTVSGTWGTERFLDFGPEQHRPSARNDNSRVARFADFQLAQGKEEVTKSPTAPCVQPPPMVRWQDYDGPLKKTVGAFAGRLERKSAHPPHYKLGAVLCSFAAKDKFILFVQDMIDPVTFMGVGFNAGIDQAENSDPTFGQGAAGYGKRFGANFADEASSTFFKDFAFPSLFAEDPRYYRLIHASGGRRLFHAARHAFVAHRDNGKQMFNFSQWLGTTSAVALSNTYHPGNQRGFAPAAERVGWSVLTDVG